MTNYFSKIVLDSDITDYESFSVENRKKINKYLNSILWFCVLTGPAIAIGIKLGVFTAVTYATCFTISIIMYIVALFHFLMLEKWASSMYPGIFAMLCIDILLCVMNVSHIHIHITWFFVPLISILFCDKRVYIHAIISNFIFLTISSWMVSPYYASINLDYDTTLGFFFNTIAGYTIEIVVMLVAGIGLVRIIDDYLHNLINKNINAKEQLKQMNAQMDILNSMTGIYEHANLLDFRKMTEMSLIGNNYEPHSINLEAHAHTRMNHMLKRKVIVDQFDDFQEFTNIRTIVERLTGKKSIYKEFISTETGWFRAQYISVETDEKQAPYVIIYTIQNIDKEKHREEQLMRISLTDELTKLYNRRCLDGDLAEYNEKEMEDDFVVASIDLNRLKYANDTKGHAAGDEIIRGAADCLVAAIGSLGKVYRTGGDEFTAIIHTKDIGAINDRIYNEASQWKGVLMDSLAMSVGYASHKQYPEKNIDELIKEADSMMYEEKTRYYVENGFERRGHRS